MDTTITASETSGAAAATEIPVQPTGTESAASENTQVEGGGEQSSAEGGNQDVGGRRKFTQLDQIKELRAERRELRERLSAFDDVRAQLAEVREQLNRQAQPKDAKTPANFWQDPEARLQSLRDEIRDEIGVQNRGLMEAFHQTREQEYAQQALRQEQASATEFIRAQKGYDTSDDDDLIEIIDAIPNKQHLSPQWVAEFAWLKLQQSRGVGDRGLAKRQAAGVQGQPPGAGFGRKTWNRAEFDAACDALEKDPHNPKNNELLKELESAHKEGRVK